MLTHISKRLTILNANLINIKCYRKEQAFKYATMSCFSREHIAIFKLKFL